jgi:hypothetical protein
MTRQDGDRRLAVRRVMRAFVLLAFAGMMAGCAGNVGGAQVSSSMGGPMAAMASASSGGQTVAFESIDGPPPQVFDRFVNVLTSESPARNVAVVSREAAPAYRIRSYLSAQVRGGRTVIAWVWDVYDRDQQRVLRLSGEEAAGKAGRDAWMAADDQVLRKIAQSGLISLSGFVNGTAPPDLPRDTPPAGSGPAIASLSADSATAGAVFARVGAACLILRRKTLPHVLPARQPPCYLLARRPGPGRDHVIHRQRAFGYVEHRQQHRTRGTIDVGEERVHQARRR